MNNYIKNIKWPSKQEVDDFYLTYLLAHKNPWNKLLHLIGNLVTISYILFLLYLIFIFPLAVFLWVFVPYVVYPFAWAGHFIFEKNKPATFYTNPLLTKRCDWRMIKDLCLRKLSWDTRDKK